MKIKILAFFALLTLAFSSCRKCETCTGYDTKTGAIASGVQSVYTCNQTEIQAYENGTNFTDPINGDSVRFRCK